MSNSTITEIQSNNEECNFLQPHIGKGLNSKFFKIVRVGLFLLFIWTLIEIFKVIRICNGLIKFEIPRFKF